MRPRFEEIEKEIIDLSVEYFDYDKNEDIRKKYNIKHVPSFIFLDFNNNELLRKEGIVSKESGKLYSRLFEIRQTGDYDDLFNLTEEDVKPLIAKAKNYIDEISELISNQD